MHDVIAGDIRAPAAKSATSVDLLCLALSSDPGARAEAVAALRDPAARLPVVQLARAEGVLAALHETIAPLAVHIPKSERIPLALDYEANRRRNREIGEAILELAGEAHRRSVEMIALKGAMWVLEDRAGFAAWRWMGDADLLVRTGDFSTMREVLGSLGYRPARRERTLIGRERFAGHYHLMEHRRGDAPFVVEVHRDVGWRPELLETDWMFESRRTIALGLSLPCPWHAALHAIIHWQLHHYGYQRGLAVPAGLEIARFLDRDDVDWEAFAAHAARSGIEREMHAALALVAEMFRARIPAGIRLPDAARGYVMRAMTGYRSRPLALAAKQQQRVLRLWNGDRFLYRMRCRGVKRDTSRILLWALRAMRLPLIAAHLAWMVVLQVGGRVGAGYRPVPSR